MSDGLINKMTTKNKKDEPIQLSLFDEIDRQTNESSDKRKIEALNYLTAGNATFTLESTKLNKRHTYKVYHRKDDKCKDRYIVKLMYGSDNESDYKFIGIYYADTGVYKSQAPSDNKPMYDKMFASFVGMLHNHTKPWFNNCLFHKSGKCACCGRKLTTPESIERGVGPECYEKLINKNL